MPFYPYSAAKIRSLIKRAYFRIEARQTDLKNIDPSQLPDSDSEARFRMCQYVLWMIEEIENMPDPFKAGRWIGWVMAYMEIMGFIDNEESRNIIRADKESGTDR